MLKRVGKKHILIFTSVLLLILFVCLQVVHKKQNFNLSIEEKVYSNQEEYNEIEIVYPQLQGMKDEDKEYRINRLIENEINKILKQNSLFDENNLFLHLDYEVKFLNKNIISIVYKGSEGAVHNIQTRSYAILMATTIDMENETIITLNDLINDFDALSSLLLEDKFESITSWDGIKGGYKISWNYEGSKRGLLLEHLLTAADFDISNHYIEWYTDGDNLIIVDFESGYYYEYLMNFDSLQDVVDRDFIKRTKVV